MNDNNQLKQLLLELQQFEIARHRKRRVLYRIFNYLNQNPSLYSKMVSAPKTENVLDIIYKILSGNANKKDIEKHIDSLLQVYNNKMESIILKQLKQNINVLLQPDHTIKNVITQVATSKSIRQLQQQINKQLIVKPVFLSKQQINDLITSCYILLSRRKDARQRVNTILNKYSSNTYMKNIIDILHQSSNIKNNTDFLLYIIDKLKHLDFYIKEYKLNTLIKQNKNIIDNETNLKQQIEKINQFINIPTQIQKYLNQLLQKYDDKKQIKDLIQRIQKQIM